MTNAARLRFAIALLIVTSTLRVSAEEPPMHAGMLAHALDRLGNTGRILYVAAHPDDENTRLLAYLANARHLTVGYLSMTRGGGGQNLIGREQDELLDVIRTEELLSARRIDGATQRFTRMRDFGYSKTPDETLRIWGHDEALADVVWVIRTFQPDVMIARFDERPPNHGHHTASAILAREAFAAAADASRFPEQLNNGVATWQVDRLLLNVPTWREGPPPPNPITLDVGTYDPRLGLGYVDLAARSRSQHKSQGFGVAGERGPVIESFVPLLGTQPKKDIFDGLDFSWERYGDAAESFGEAINSAREKLERDAPERALPALLEAHDALQSVPDGPRVRDAKVGLADMIAASIGLYARATAARPGVVPGDTATVTLEITMRRPAEIMLREVVFPNLAPQLLNHRLSLNEKKIVTAAVPVPADAAISTPYWLAQPPLAGHQVVADPRIVGQPTAPPALTIDVALEAGKRVVHLQAPVTYVWNDQVQGERERAFLIVPPATITATRNAIMFSNGKPAAATFRIRAGQDNFQGEVRLPLPQGWRAHPASIPVTLAQAGDDTSVRFEITPPPNAESIVIRPEVLVDETSKDPPRHPAPGWNYREDIIDYPHIPMQVVLQPGHLRLSPVVLQLPKGPVGYIEGSGDTVAEDLAHVGMAVEQLDDDTIRAGNLSRYRAIIVGIRAYNTRPVLRTAHARLMDYVQRGGTVVVQYVTNNRLAPLDIPIGPYPLTLGRNRVTDENATMTPMNPKDAILHEPNRIDENDFAGWVQERGLYFADTWDPNYEPLFRAADPGEKDIDGGTLVARYGRGRYVYTGLSFFRQLPAGVPGAYRLLANLIAAER